MSEETTTAETTVPKGYIAITQREFSELRTLVKGISDLLTTIEQRSIKAAEAPPRTMTKHEQELMELQQKAENANYDPLTYGLDVKK
jgi:hypothetical protein